MGTSAPETVIHPTAVVMPGVELGAGVEIGPYAVVEPGAEIGDGCRLRPHCHITGRVILGPDTRIGNGTVIGGEPQDIKYDDSRGMVRIGARCRIFEHCTVHRPATGDGETAIGDDVMMMAGAHVGHNAQVGDSVVMVNLASVGGHAKVGERAIMTLGSSIHQFGRVGRLTLVGGYTPLVRDAPPFSIVVGLYPPAWRGPNTIGLRRAGMDAPTRDAIRAALNKIFRSGRGQVEVAGEYRDDPIPEVAELAAFFLEPGRDFVRAPRSKSSD